MKKLILFLLVALAFGACKKGDSDIAPQNPVDLVAGRYKLSSFSYQQGTQKESLPTKDQTLNGTAELVKSSKDGYVKLLVVVNNSELFGDADDVELEVRKHGKAYGLFEGSDQYADVDGSNIIFNVSGTDDNGQQIAISFVGNK